MDWGNTTVLITGGTGSLGRALTAYLLGQSVKRLVILSRDELKQHEMRQIWPDDPGSPIRYFIGDVRDKDRLLRAFDGIDVVIHAAALKHVVALEYNPFEGILTNVIGAKNVIDAAIDRGVKKVIAISTDKAVAASNAYGKTKALAESLFIQANAYAGADGTRFAVCRYGNVAGSRGSVIPVFAKQRERGALTITDVRMTRFWLTLDEAVGLVQYSLEAMRGGEIFVPKIPSMHITDLATAIAPECRQQETGIRPGEKLHEALLSEDEISHTLDAGDVYVVQPMHPWWTTQAGEGAPLPDGFRYSSDVNDKWLSVDDLRRVSGLVVEEPKIEKVGLN